MKNIDIENIERKNIYRVPESFFEEMQDNVLQNIEQKIQKEIKPKAKIFSLDWKYVAAASIVMIFGLSLFVLNYDGHQVKDGHYAHDSLLAMQHDDSLHFTGQPERQENHSETSPESREKILTLKNDLSSQRQYSDNQPVVNKKAAVSKTKTTNAKTAVTTEDNMDLILSVYTPNELNELARESEQDVYLDLYN